LIFGIIVCIAAGGIGTHAFAGQVTLAWDANTEPDLAGYKIHYGAASGNYTVHLDVRNVTTYTGTGLTAGHTYYFAPTAYHDWGNESGYSNQVIYSGSATPVITAGPQAASSSVTLPASTTVSVTASNPASGALTYAWSKKSGPGTATFANAAAASTTVAFSTAGSYTLQVTVSNGQSSVSGSVNVSVLSGGSSSSQAKVVSFTLVNATTDQDIGPLANGDVINLALTGTKLNIRANVSGSVGSVRFALDGNTNFRTENGAPYTLAGDSSGNYAAWTPALGSHSLTATPYAASGASGTAGSPLSIGFSVTNAVTSNPAPVITAGPQAASSSVTLPASTTSTGSVSLLGQSVSTTSGSVSEGAALDNISDSEAAAIQDGATGWSIALFRPSTGEWFLDLNGNRQWEGQETDGRYQFGSVGDWPVSGDWNQDVFAEIGVFRPSTGEWLLDLNGNHRWDGNGTDGRYQFGQSGDLPVTGDWNNDGITEIGVFRPSTGEWLLDLNGNRKWDGSSLDGLYKFGKSGDLPVTGDWNHDGVTEIGVFRPSTGEWLLELNGNDKWDGSSLDGLYKFGTNGDRPVAGPW